MELSEFSQIPVWLRELRELNMLSVTIRLLLALLSGTLIGIDRGMKRRGAGIKTHVLVCLGATLVMMTGQYIVDCFGTRQEVARLGAQVISGVGFLGVGTIIVTGRNEVRGLTTAAGLWACACIGLALGIGFYEGAFVMLVLVLVTFVGLARLDRYVYMHSRVLELYIEVDSAKSIVELRKQLRKMDLRIAGFETMETMIRGDDTAVMTSIELAGPHMHDSTIQAIRDIEGVVYVEEL